MRLRAHVSKMKIGRGPNGEHDDVIDSENDSEDDSASNEVVEDDPHQCDQNVSQKNLCI